MLACIADANDRMTPSRLIRGRLRREGAYGSMVRTYGSWTCMAWACHMNEGRDVSPTHLGQPQQDALEGQQNSANPLVMLSVQQHDKRGI